MDTVVFCYSATVTAVVVTLADGAAVLLGNWCRHDSGGDVAMAEERFDGIAVLCASGGVDVVPPAERDVDGLTVFCLRSWLR